jgi:hypothetical protein
MIEWFYRIDSKEVLIISNWDKGLYSAVLEVFSSTYYLYYYQYITNNV